MKRERIQDIIHSGRLPRRFTQDTPILPDVWIEYAVHPGERKRLLITPWQGPGRFHTTPGQLSVVVRRRLQAVRDRPVQAHKGGPKKSARGAEPRPPLHVAYN